MKPFAFALKQFRLEDEGLNLSHGQSICCDRDSVPIGTVTFADSHYERTVDEINIVGRVRWFARKP